MSIPKEEAERVVHLNSLMSEIYDDVSQLSEGLFDRDKSECELALDHLIPFLQEIRDSIDHEIR